jgi:alpha-mannosidase
LNKKHNITPLIAKLRDRVQRNTMDQWRTGDSLEAAKEGSIADLNEKGQITWPKGRLTQWLYQEIQLPEAFVDYPLAGMTARLALTWWADAATVYINGEPVQAGDLFDHSARVVLQRQLVPGSRWAVALHLVSPCHDMGALMRSRLICEAADGSIDPGFVADELAVIGSYVAAFEPDRMGELEALVTGGVQPSPTLGGLAALRANLQPWSRLIKQHEVALLGHAHLDMAWLWPIAETWAAAERTFVSALNLQKDFPSLTFCHTTPALYAWMEEHRPELFAQIQAQVKAGKWEPIGGLWVEPEANLIGAESMVRQILYGQRYYQEKFGSTSAIAWLPDTFGFPWQLPQILSQGGITHFVTQKLRWNDTNQYPDEYFRWQSPDGTAVTALMSGPIGEGIDPEKIADYCWDWRQRTGLNHALWLTGVGDHGGGPTRDMLEIADRWSRSPFFPRITYKTAQNYLEAIESTDLPVQNHDLYLEFHRGCYSVHRDQKLYNHQCELALYQAELWSSLASLAVGFDYPYDEIETAWKQVLFNQFHDILPGTSIPEVYSEANPNWQAALATGQTLTNQALMAIAQQVTNPSDGQARILFNPCPWDRTTWCGLVPALGYLTTTAAPPRPHPVEPSNPWVLENDLLTVTIDPTTGAIASLIYKPTNYEYIQGLANHLQFFQDQDQYWDAWNIDPQYAQHPLVETTPITAKRQDDQLTERLTLRTTFRQSSFTTTYVLDQTADSLRVETQVDWQERHVLVKVAFPLTLSARVATYDMPAGVIDRPTLPTTPAEKAQWEVPALSWASLTDGKQGFSLLTPSLHGYDHTPHQLRLTLLRGVEWPDPTADRGLQTFTYALYPHPGDWRSAQVPRHTRDLALPLTEILIDRLTSNLPATASLLQWPAQNLELLSLKASEKRDGSFVLRGYESQGSSGCFDLGGLLDLQIGDRLDLLENPTPEQTPDLKPWTIASFRLRRSSAPDRQ